jgi:hypothetical protein
LAPGNSDIIGTIGHQYLGMRRPAKFVACFTQVVTHPVYSRSVARWRAYEKHLAPILPALEPYCRMLGYE